MTELFFCVLTQSGPSRDGRDWLIYGDEYGKIRLDNVPGTLYKKTGVDRLVSVRAMTSSRFV
ncbi:MAG TPA: hypothetical protein VIF37_15580 [Methylobacter sp.]|jgi:hypothetical protein